MISAKAEEKLNDIKNNNEGTTEEKQIAIQNIRDAKNSADNQITQDITNQNVESAQSNGLTTISRIQPNFTKNRKHEIKSIKSFKTKRRKLTIRQMRLKKKNKKQFNG